MMMHGPADVKLCGKEQGFVMLQQVLSMPVSTAGF